MKTKTILGCAMAVSLLAGIGVYPAVSELNARISLTADAASNSGTTTDGWKYSVVDGTYCKITGATAIVQGNVAFPSQITLDDGVTTLPVKEVDSIYYSGSDITGLTIPASITILPKQFCELKKNLKTVKFEGSLVSLPASAFLSCSNLETITLPSGLSTIGNSAFSNCTRLASIQIPNTVSTIENYAFQNCEALKSITIPGSVTSLSDSMFKGCTALEKVTLENGIKSVANNVFANCTSLKEVTFPKSVTSLTAANKFTGCNNLESITIENPDCELGNLSGTADKPLIIYGYEGSTAETYCTKNGKTAHLEFKSIGEKPQPSAAADTGAFCDADGDGQITSLDAQYVLIYAVEDMMQNKPSWYAITKNPKAPDAP